MLLCSQCQTDSCTVFTGYGVEVMLRLLVSDGHCYLFRAKNPCPITSPIYNIFVKFLFKISRNVPRHVNKENTVTFAESHFKSAMSYNETNNDAY